MENNRTNTKHSDHSNDSHAHCCRHHSHSSSDHHSHGNHHHHEIEGRGGIRRFVSEIITGCLLLAFLIAYHFFQVPDWLKCLSYVVSLIPVGTPVIAETIRSWRKGDIFNEFTLMLLASLGAFIIGEYPEGVAVLLFYSIGEKLEDVVSGDVKGQIKRLIGKMPKYANVADGERVIKKKPEDVVVGDIIIVRPGESVPLDGKLAVSGEAAFDTSAMTGESVPRVFANGDAVAAGCIPVDREVRLIVTRIYSDSSLSRIISMIEQSSANRAPSESVLRKITRWYTPLVMAAAILLIAIPFVISLINPSFDFVWQDWFRRSLVFLVCSCPCALVVSIPLTYFASIGIASKHGILFKGHRQLDDIRKAKCFFFDKTGTVTTGMFHISSISPSFGIDSSRVLQMAASVDSQSNHPLARAIVDEAARKSLQLIPVSDVRTVSHGMQAVSDGKAVLVGSESLMRSNGVDIPETPDDACTEIFVAEDGRLLGIIYLADTVKAGAAESIAELRTLGAERIGILSGDRTESVASVAKTAGVDFYRAALLPTQKEKIVEEETRKGTVTVFTGDGINDAPSIAEATVGIAMGTLGSDLAIESADIVIAGDDLRKIPEAVIASRKVKSLLIENVTFAFGVKIAVMILGAFGIATLWAAVFADTGVTLVTVIWTLCRLRIWQLRR